MSVEVKLDMSDDPRKGQTSASNAAADALCAGRFLAQRGRPDVKGEWSESGTAVHRALATGDVSKLTLAENETYEACRTIASRLVAEYFGPKITPTVFVEQRMWTRFAVKFQTSDGEKVGELGHSGQVDVVFKNGVKAMVLDYKSLQGETPESPKNLQLRDLAVLVRGNLMPVSEVAVAIVQPLVTHSPEVCLYTTEDLVRAEAEMKTRIVRSNDPKSPRVAGQLQCAYCLSKTNCSAYSTWAGAMLPLQNEAEALVVQTAFQTAMAEWSPHQRAQVAAVLAPAAKALEQMKEFLKEGLAKDPEFVPGWELKNGNRLETIVDPQKCFERFLALGGKQEQFLTAVKVGKTRLKQALHDAIGKKGRALDETLKILLDGLVGVSENAPSLQRKDEK
jgi:hypothetical protein